MRTTHFFGVLSCLLALAACSKQGEGERCDLNSVNLDCESGLVCRSGDELSITGRGAALCCPPDGVPPTVNACRAGADLPPDEEQLPPELPPEGDVDAGDGGA